MELDAWLKTRADEVRALLAEGIELLARHGLATEPLRQALADLEGPFLLVVAGEFNSGKSSLLNALLGAPLLKEGVTPTTDKIQLIAYGEGSEVLGEDLVLLRFPHELLKTLRFVDTPGTNAVIQRHQVLTEQFLPRADLILFVTSADRPFTESERQFLELIRSWGKKVALVVNKADLLDEAGKREVRAFVEEHAAKTLGFSPPVFLVSAKTGEGLPELEAKIREVLKHEAARIKLASPLGVLLKLLDQGQEKIQAERQRLLAEAERCRTLDALLERHLRQTREEFAGRKARLAQVFAEIEARGERWFQEHVRLGRIFDLLNASRVQKSFESEVIQDAEEKLMLELTDALAWIGRRERDLLASALDLIKTTRPLEAEEDEALKARLQEALSRFSPEAEAAFVQSRVESALKATALAEAGAVGLGAMIALLLHGLAADVTGLTAGLAAAILGLSVLPRRREAAFREFKRRLAEIKRELEAALEAALEEELEKSAERFRALYRPDCERVKGELEALEAEAQRLEALAQRAMNIKAVLENF